MTSSAAVLGQSDQLEKLAFMSRERFVSALVAGGFTEEEMDRWHAAFERTSPEEHQRFLEFLCIPDREIRAIRDWSARPRRPQPRFPRRS